MKQEIKIPKFYLDLIDQIFELERKVEAEGEIKSLKRNINKMKEIFENILTTEAEHNGGLFYHNPLGEKYDETRIDLEVSIAGNSTEDLIVTEVIKPIIRYKKGGINSIVRKGVVVVENKII